MLQLLLVLSLLLGRSRVACLHIDILRLRANKVLLLGSERQRATRRLRFEVLLLLRVRLEGVARRSRISASILVHLGNCGGNQVTGNVMGVLLVLGLECHVLDGFLGIVCVMGVINDRLVLGQDVGVSMGNRLLDVLNGCGGMRSTGCRVGIMELIGCRLGILGSGRR